MRVYVYPADLAGCGYYRLIWVSMYLKSIGKDIRLIHPSQRNKITGGRSADGRLVQVSVPKDADVIVFQRLTSRTIVEGINIMRQNGVAVVVDVDDDMRTVAQQNPAWRQFHPGKGVVDTSEYNWMNGQRACESASLVTVSSDALLKRYGQPRRAEDGPHGLILRNYVPEVLTDIEHVEEPGVIGWGGSLHSHPTDPDVLGTSMLRLTRDGEFRFKVVGPPKGTKQAFHLLQAPEATGAVPIDRWPHELSKLSVGIAPLKDTVFNRAKSWLKPLEYAAVGVPSVMSDLPEYALINSLGVGRLARNARDWHRESKRLLSDDAYRLDMSERGRAIVRERLTLERNALQWWDAWTQAYEIEQGTRTRIEPVTSI